ncbi:MAG TPA: DUF5069 domain-containing protein [Candidatus Paceibacterota bacterium]|nr:DUF5069 domain-containing protein [Verrucomicrobiota bacterium]HRY46802.1 DUF5069 domain-containing protein [Candidatus Paceibacterota bacterium]HSA02035.1 DUF5069 domain-containing protein [Candidatus Paceibacterota bacterium]
MELIYPRSPREVMAGWVHLGRFVDKIRLHLAGQLHPDYQNNFTKGFDALWLQAAGLTAEHFIDVVRQTLTDGQVVDWVRINIKKTDAEKALFRDTLLNYGRQDDDHRARLKQRKEEARLGYRDDIQTFVDLIDADEKRLPDPKASSMVINIPLPNFAKGKYAEQ